MNEFFGMLGLGFLTCIAIALIWLYIRNILMIVDAFKKQSYSVLLVSRIAGIFFPIWGIVMGIV
jgi:hypothetical protein